MSRRRPSDALLPNKKAGLRRSLPWAKRPTRVVRRLQAHIQAIVASRAARCYWPVAGGKVTFDDTADFITVAAALEAYVSNLLLAEASLAASNPATWPVQPVEIP